MKDYEEFTRSHAIKLRLAECWLAITEWWHRHRRHL